MTCSDNRCRKTNTETLSDGFKFGMLLQFAVGPICLMVLNVAVARGFCADLAFVAAVALMDALFITLSGLGIAAIMEKPRIKTAVKLFGCLILMLFGATIVWANLQAAPTALPFAIAEATTTGLFMQGLVLTASNPLTIVFWTGVFSAQVAQNKFDKTHLFFFGAGCVLSTLVFLSFVAFLGSLLPLVLPAFFIQGLNILVGGFLIFFGARLFLKN